MSNDKPSEHIEFSDKDREDLAALGVTTGDEPQFHPILQVFREVLKPARSEKDTKVTPQYANRIVQSYKGIDFADMNLFRDTYYDKIIELEEILLEVIASDDQCLLPTTPEEDKAENSKHYKTLLLEWQKAFMRWEVEWDTAAPDAAVQLGAIGEVHKMFFSQDGITAYLQNIQFEFTEQDQAEVQAELEAIRTGGDGE